MLASSITWPPNDKTKKVFISAFLLFHLVVIVSGAIPPNFFLTNVLHVKGLLITLADKLGSYPATAGLQVGWNMFAPNPTRNNSYIRAEITYRDGREEEWSFPQMQELGYAERYVKERYRKFATEGLWVPKNSLLWPGVARYIARLRADASNPPRIVKLVHYWTIIPSPTPVGAPPPSIRLRRYEFFAYTVNPSDLR